MARKYAIGIDLGGTTIKYGVCDDSGQILKTFSRPTRADQPDKEILKDLADAAKEALTFAQNNNLKIHCIGLGTPGTVDVERGHVTGNSPNFKYWYDVPIKLTLEKELNLPVWVDNDANLMIYGEYKFGAGMGHQNIVGLTLGTGIGGGIIIDGELFRGSNYAGSEIGHMSICYNGIPCRCGGYGCWEKYASATAMITNYNALNPTKQVTNTLEIFNAFERNEEDAVEVINNEIKLVAVGITNLVNIFNPKMVIVGGGVSEAGDWFVDKIAKHVNLIAIKPGTIGLKVVRAKLGNQAGMLGAAAFALAKSNF
jgi:glucokinase